MANVRIDIASEFDNKGFKKAQAATNQLDQAVGKLGKKMIGAFSAYKILQFSKDSVKAFAQDEKAAASLANELKNMGLSFNAPAAEDFIHTMQKQTGVLDDELRPAYAQLIRISGSMAETQKLMSLAFDVSSGTGQDYKTVIDALSQAYVGNTKGLKSLNTGLTQAELKTKSFAEITDILTQKFKGAGAAAVDTYAGKMNLLKASVADAQETIGKGFIDAFTTIGNDQNFNDTLDKIDNAALAVADMIRGVGVALDAISTKTPQWLIDFLNPTNKGLLLILKNLGKDKRLSDPQLSANTSYFSRVAAAKQAAAAEKLALQRAKDLADTIKKQNQQTANLLKKKKEAAALDALSLKYLQQSKIFNEEQIQLAAAIQNKGLSKEDQIRINLKKDLLDLETAIQNKDIEGATALAAKIDLEYKQLGYYQSAEKALNSITSILNSIKPIDLININNLIEALAKLQLLNVPLTQTQQQQQSAATAVIEKEMDRIIAEVLPNAAAEEAYVMDEGVLAAVAAVGGVPTPAPNAYGPGITVTIVDNTSGLIDVVTNATQQASANGINTRILRNTGGLSW